MSELESETECWLWVYCSIFLKKKKSVHYLEFPSLLEHGSSHSLHRNYPSKEMHVLPGNQNSRGESVNS